MKCEKLDVWKMSARLSAEVYKKLVDTKDFGFREGMEKDSVKERIKFLDIAKGSAAEFITQVYIGMDINYIGEVDGKEWVGTGEKILGMLTRLQDNLRSRLHNT